MMEQNTRLINIMGQEQARHITEIERYKRQSADMEVLRRDSERESIRQVDNVKSQAVFNVCVSLPSLSQMLIRSAESCGPQFSSQVQAVIAEARDCGTFLSATDGSDALKNSVATEQTRRRGERCCVHQRKGYV